MKTKNMKVRILTEEKTKKEVVERFWAESICRILEKEIPSNRERRAFLKEVIKSLENKNM